MKILVFSTNGVLRDGITSWLMQYFRHMDRSGLEVHTVAAEGVSSSLLEELAALDIKTHVLPHRRRAPVAYLRSLRRLLRANSYDVLHVNGNSGTVALELLCAVGSSTRVRIAHSRNTQGEHPSADRVLRPVMSRLCTERLACGRDAGKWLFGDSPFTVIPNGKDFADYDFDPGARSRLRQQLGLSSDTIAVGHVGNFTEQKNHRFLVSAFALARRLNPQLHLFLIGDGDLRPAIQKLVADLGIEDSVTFVGRTTDVASYLSAFDAAALPSNHEGFPNVVIEWQISGLPSFVSSSVTDECGVTDLVTFLAHDDQRVWADALAGFRPIERRNAAIGAQQRLKATGFDVHDGAAKLRAIYGRLLKETQ